MRYAIYTTAYYRALRANDALATLQGLAIRKLTTDPSLQVPSQPWRDVRQFERMFGHVFIDGQVMRLMDDEAKEGTYQNKVAAEWARRLLAAVEGKQLQQPVYLNGNPRSNTDGYYVIRNGDGDSVCVHLYLIDTLQAIYQNGWDFWLRDFDYN